MPPITASIPVQSFTERQRWQAFAVAVSVAAITILDLSKVNVALPSIEAAFSAGSTELQLVVSGYVLTFGLALVPMGRLGDQRSRRMLFIIGLTLFTITSLVCAIAPNSTVLLIGRLVQGIAAGIQMPQVLGLIQSLFHGAERGRAFGLFGATIGLATAFGPTLGGLLIAVGGDTDGWRLIFWMNVPLSIAAIVLALFLLPGEPKTERKRLDLDPLGVVLLGATVLCLMVPFLFTTGAPTDDPRRWWVLVGFGIFGAIFVAWELRYADAGRLPVLPFSLFSIASFRNGTILSSAYFAALPALFLMTTLFLQQGVGLEPVYAGMVTIGFALASALASYIAGRHVLKLGRKLVVWGLIVMLATVVALGAAAYYLPGNIVPWAMAAIMLVGGIGGGVVVSPNQTLTLVDVPVSDGGSAGSVGQLSQRIGTAIGTAVALSLFYATVYDEEGSASTLVVYHDAYAFGLIAVGVCVGIALIVGVVDSARTAKAASDDDANETASASS